MCMTLHWGQTITNTISSCMYTNIWSALGLRPYGTKSPDVVSFNWAWPGDRSLGSRWYKDWWPLLPGRSVCRCDKGRRSGLVCHLIEQIHISYSFPYGERCSCSLVISLCYLYMPRAFILISIHQLSHHCHAPLSFASCLCSGRALSPQAKGDIALVPLGFVRHVMVCVITAVTPVCAVGGTQGYVEHKDLHCHCNTTWKLLRRGMCSCCP